MSCNTCNSNRTGDIRTCKHCFNGNEIIDKNLLLIGLGICGFILSIILALIDITIGIGLVIILIIVLILLGLFVK